MAYSQKDLITLFKTGAVPGETTVPKHIETVISNVFLFPTVVYKIYKSDNDFFNTNFRDISSKKERFEFTEKDFAWNNLISPSVYVKIVGANTGYNQIDFVETGDSADELVIVMSLIDAKDFLFEKLLRGEITESDAATMGTQLATSLKRARTADLTGPNYFKLARKRIQDVRDWIKGVSDRIPESEWGAYCDYLDTFREKHRELFEGKLSQLLANAGDLHSHNAVYTKGQLHLVDTYPPKEEWITEYHMVPVYRLGVDLWALGSKEIYDAYLKSYEREVRVPIDTLFEPYYILYGAIIQVSYLYMLERTDHGRKEEVARHHKFIREYFAQIAR